MKTTQFLHSPFVQICYHVPDVEAAARQFSELFGWGPFLVLHHVGIEQCIYRGKPGEFDHSTACGQAGPIQVELVQQHGDSPSVMRDMYTADQFGVAHHASFVDDMDKQLKHFNDLGFPTAMRAKTTAGIEFAFIDTRALLGYMLEIYPRGDIVMQWYHMVRKAAENWDGKDPVRLLTEKEL
jgi:hypothetical protein